jgi:molybdopterin synthase catalytic subunit
VEDDMYKITQEKLSIDDLYKIVLKDSHGAVATFAGVVRDHSGDKRTDYLEYEAYTDMAEKKMAEIGGEVGEKWGIDDMAILHRVGRLEIGEISVLIAVASPHRVEAFAACKYAIDRLKETVPIWKKEVGEDGNYWVEGPVSASKIK